MHRTYGTHTGYQVVGPVQWGSVRSSLDASDTANSLTSLTGPTVRLLVLTDDGLTFVQLHLPLRPATLVQGGGVGVESDALGVDAKGHAERCVVDQKEQTEEVEQRSSRPIAHMIPTAIPSSASASPLARPVKGPPGGPSGLRLTQKQNDAARARSRVNPSVAAFSAEDRTTSDGAGKENAPAAATARVCSEASERGMGIERGERGVGGTVVTVGSRMITEVRQWYDAYEYHSCRG
jgi:hypothetical protein